jgi:regulator of protease activity HflC (stomatin/prohibitin superfamily)
MDTAPLLKVAPPPVSAGIDSGGAPDQSVLAHLLQIESEAAALVDDAQAEADRRLAEGEKQNRQRYDDGYSREAAELDARFEGEIRAVKEDYQNRLGVYRESLNRMAANTENFSGLVESLLFEICPAGKE